jgi:hypothetical protein
MTVSAARMIPRLRIVFASTLSFELAMIIATLFVDRANEAAGMMQYRLPVPLFWSYVWIGISAPVAALVTLFVLRVTRSVERPPPEAHARVQLALLCAANVAGFALWFWFGGRVFFGAGGVR